MAIRNALRWRVVSATLLSMYAAPAAGHGGIPRAIVISVAPGNPARIAAQSDAWGLLVSADHGATFSWWCPEVFEGDALGLSHPAMAITPDGGLLVANEGQGLWRSSPDGCEWQVSDSLAGETVRDVVQSGDGAELFVLTSRIEAGAATSRIWQSADGAATVRPWGTELPSGAIAAAVAVHFAERRFYVAAVDGVSREVVLLSSNDEGASWQPTITPVVTSTSRPRLTVDLADASRLYLRHDRLPASQSDPDPSDEIYLSTDGGANFSLLLRGGSDLPGLAFSPDGTTVAVAGPAEGLLLADRDELAVAGEAAFRRVFDGPLWGLAWTEDGLYAGHDDFSEAGSRMWLGISQNEGETFSPVTTICDAAPASCGDSTAYAKACNDAFTRLGGFRESILLAPRCESAVEQDAGPPPSPRPEDSSSGCACTVSKKGAGAALVFCSGLAFLLFARRFRREGHPDHGSVQT